MPKSESRSGSPRSAGYATRDYALGPRGLLDWALVALFFLASRDTLSKFYKRSGMLLAAPLEPPTAPEPEVDFE